MELFTKFKRDYINYLISIIIPAFISGISIPVFKHLLGAEDYGKFALWYNGILIAMAILSGWIGQSILRLYHAYPQHRRFSDYSVKLSLTTQMIFVLPVFFVSYLIGNDFLVSMLCCLALIAGSLQFTIVPVVQSAFLSGKIIYSELMRVLIYVGGSALLLMFTKINFLYCLFSAVIVSYLASFYYLTKQKDYFITDDSKEPFVGKNQLKKFISYGMPLSIWFVFTCLMTYVDKLFTLKFFGSTVQGNYQALFDLISKGLVLLISPAITSLFPILTSAFEKKDFPGVRQLILKISFLEFFGFLIISVAYWTFGARLLFFILKIPETSIFRRTGFIIICATFVWQFAILAQKRSELYMKTTLLLILAGTAFLLQLAFYYIFRNSGQQLIAPLGYLLSGVFYLTAILIPLSKRIFLYRNDLF